MLMETKTTVNLPQLRQPDETVDALIAAWVRELVRHGSTIPTLPDITFAQGVFAAWKRSDTLDRPAIVAAPPGFGKSTMLSAFLHNMVRNSAPAFGAIVVKERLADVKALAAYINEDYAEGPLVRRHSYAYFIEGYDEDAMDREQYAAQFTTQANYPVVIMTTKQFELQVLKGNISAFHAFIDEDKVSRPRRTLLIDEKPILTVSYALTENEINQLLEDIRVAGVRANSKLKLFYRTARDRIVKLRDQYETTDTVERVSRLQPVDRMYLLPRDLLNQFTAVHSDDITKLARLRALEHVIRYGGIFSITHGAVNVQSARKMSYEWTSYNAFVLDGTGRIDPEYASGDFYVIEPENKPDYSNVTFNVCNAFNLSKGSIRGDVEALDNITAECKRIVARHSGAVLIVTYNEFKDALESKLADEVASGRVVFKHFDGGRGSNDYVGIDTAIYIGTLNKGSLFYPAQAQAVLGDSAGVTLGIDFTVCRNGLTYKDPVVESYRQLDTAVNIVQETNRLRANRKTEPVNFYVFSRDEATTQHITDAYTGCKIAEYYTDMKLAGAKTADDNIVAFLRSMSAGTRIKQSEIYRQLGITRKTMQRFMANAQPTLDRLGVLKMGTFLEKSS